MAIALKSAPENIALCVWSQTSKLGISAAHQLSKLFSVVSTTKVADTNTSHTLFLDIANTKDVLRFVSAFKEKHPNTVLSALFLNAGVMNRGKHINRFTLTRRQNAGDPEVTTHINNLVLVEQLKFAWLISEKTKIIYNASVQIFDPKEWFEDYATLKRIMTSCLLGYRSLDVTILCLALVKWTKMADEYLAHISNPDDFIAQYMPEGQPTLAWFSHLIEKIIAEKEYTRDKFIIYDGGMLKMMWKVSDELLEYGLVYTPDTDTFSHFE